MISPDALAMVLDSLRAGVPLAGRQGAARAAGTTVEAVRELAGDGTPEGRAWAEALSAALAEGERARAAVTWQEVAKASEPTVAHVAVTGGAPVSHLAPDDAARWDAIRNDAARRFGAGDFGQLLWMNERCAKAGMDALDDWWLWDLRAFYASGKQEHAGRVGLRGAKSTSIPRPLTRDALFIPRRLDPTVPGVIPIISVDKTEADGRFNTIRGTLRACGMAPKKPDDSNVPILPDGIAGIYESSTLASGGGVIYFRDSEGHDLEFRIYAAKVAGAVGYTGVSGFCDEVDLWVDDRGVNPAERVLDLLAKRFTTQRAAHLYIFSASYYPNSAHKRKIDEGDTALQHLARLGPIGAERDTAARHRLSAQIKSNDPRLLAPADPMSPDIPSWVTNPLVTIEDCYMRSKDRLGPMLALYGGRASEATGGKSGGAWTVEDWTAHREAMRDLNPRPATDPGWTLNGQGLRVASTPERYRGL